jgi:ABC-type uncharacterized transport system substrate-binding protein
MSRPGVHDAPGSMIGHKRADVMIRSTRSTLLSVIACLGLAGADAAGAHPHVWVTMKSELIFAPDSAITGVRHNWTFDDTYSVYATQGLPSKQRGRFTREELASLAEVSVTSLKEYRFFTFAKADGKKVQFTEPIDYYLDYDPKLTVLTLHFTLPLKTPIKAKQLDFDIYDPTIFVDFAFNEKDPVGLVGAPAACKLSVVRAGDAGAQAQRLPESFFNSLDASGSWGSQFANKIGVKCP